MAKLIIIAGPALVAAVAVSTKMPVPIVPPMPSMVSWNGPRLRVNGFFCAVARIVSSDLIRQFMQTFPLAEAGAPEWQPGSS
jgi:hypothetical protein